MQQGLRGTLQIVQRSPCWCADLAMARPDPLLSQRARSCQFHRLLRFLGQGDVAACDPNRLKL
jgi:hypothetical protein